MKRNTLNFHKLLKYVVEVKVLLDTFIKYLWFLEKL